MRIQEMSLSPKQAEIFTKLRDKLSYFCKNSLKIKTKQGKLEPFTFNKAQRYIHKRLEEQLAETGMVRALILKGRQQGCSTYVAARYYHKTIWNGYTGVYIMSHESDSTAVLFGKVKTYWEKSPPVARPKVVVANRTEFEFENGSSYKVGTAGARNTGRGNTVQLFHGSEVAFYEDTKSIRSGILQTVGDVPGTELILESTANGIGDFFHEACMLAVKGVGGYILIFVPWFWQEEYRRKVPANFQFTDDELRLQKLYGWDDEQLCWRHFKIAELGERLFKQEYPNTVNEAFQASGERLYDADTVQNARKAKISDLSKEVVIGVDPGRNVDRTVIAVRQGRTILEYKAYEPKDKMYTIELAGQISLMIDKYQAMRCYIDFGAGVGIFDKLVDMGYGHIVQTVNFGSRADDPDRYVNKRTEMAFRLKEWLDGGDISIPDDEALEVDIMSIPDFKVNGKQQKLIPSKDEIKKELGRSPDIFDAIILTFAYLVASSAAQARIPKHTLNTKQGSALKTLRRVRQTGIGDDEGYWEGDVETDTKRSPHYNQYRRRR